MIKKYKKIHCNAIKKRWNTLIPGGYSHFSGGLRNDIPPETIKKFLRRDSTDMLKYTDPDFMCMQFMFVLMGKIVKKFKACNVGLIVHRMPDWTYSHAEIVTYNSGNEYFYLVKPQLDKVILYDFLKYEREYTIW